MKGIGDGIWNELILRSKNRGVWNGDCGIVDGITDEWVELSKEKVEWLREVIQSIGAKKWLETGTNYGSWSWLLYNTLEGDWSMDTVDVVEESQTAIKRINDYYGEERVRFHHMDSIDFLQNWEDSVDAIWVDSGHTAEHLSGELKEIKRLGIQWVLIDDWNWSELNPTILKFVEESDYHIWKSSPKGTQWSGVVVLTL